MRISPAMLRYLLGLSLGIMLFGAPLIWFVDERHAKADRVSDEAPIWFEPPARGSDDNRVVFGEPREWELKIRSGADDVVTITDLTFECPGSRVELCSPESIPTVLSSLGSLSLRIRITADKGRRGFFPLAYSANCQLRNHQFPIVVDGECSIEVISELNSDPLVVLLGEITSFGQIETRFAKVWSPAALSNPGLISAESDDPCIHVRVKKLNLEKSRADNIDRVDVAELEFSIDTSVAPERLRSSVLVRMGDAEMQIPILGFVIRPRNERRETENARTAQ